MKKIRLCSGLLLASLSFGGADTARAATAEAVSAPAAVTPAQTQALQMKAVFGTRYRPAAGDVSGYAFAKLPMPRDRKKQAPYLIRPLTSTVLKTGETVFITQAELADEKGQEIGGEPGQENLVSAYLLRANAGSWTVLKRHENLVHRGMDQRPGSVLFPMLGKDKQGLAIIHGLVDEGCSVFKLHLFDLTQETVHDLADGIRSGSNDTEYCAGDDLTAITQITSKWHLAPSKKPGAVYDDLVMVFSIDTTRGAKKDGGKRPPASPTEKLTARYAYNGKV